MKILHVLPVHFPASVHYGTVAAVHGLTRALAGRGHEVEIVATNRTGKVSGEPLLWRDGVKIRCFESTKPQCIYYAPDMTATLQDLIEASRVVHIHRMHQWPGWMAARIAHKRGTPYIVSPHGTFSKDIRDRYFINKIWSTLLDRRSLERASAIHATSNLEQAEIENFDFATPDVITIPNGVDPLVPVLSGNGVSQDIRDACAREPLVVYLGRLNPVRELERLVRAFSTTQSGYLVISGPDGEGAGSELSALASMLRISHRVLILPRIISPAEKGLLFAAARVFVTPTYAEASGYTAMEAMRCGVPVIATPQLVVAEIVRRSGGGLVISGEPDALGYALSRFLNHPLLARSMGAAAQRYVVEHHSWDKIAERMEALYSNIMTKSL